METAELEVFDRGLRHATATRSGKDLDAALGDLGWSEALAADRRAAVSLLFEHQGKANTTSGALDRVLVAGLGLLDTGAPVVLPSVGRRAMPGRLAGGRCVVRGVLVGGASADSTTVVVEMEGRGVALSVPTSSLELRPVGGLDPALCLVEVGGEIDPAQTSPHGDVHWEEALALGQLALGHELVGASRAMLELASQHALARVQFGRPISSFQAVRHRLADSLVAIEAAAALLDAAWDEPSPAVAAMAKAFAGHGASTAGRHCQQVLAGMGFTKEHPFHRYLRRTIVLDRLLGAGNDLTRQLGADVLAHRPPPTFPL